MNQDIEGTDICTGTVCQHGDCGLPESHNGKHISGRLIAAASKLLEAAEKTPHSHLGMTEYKQQCALCAAIRKARGQS